MVRASKLRQVLVDAAAEAGVDEAKVPGLCVAVSADLATRIGHLAEMLERAQAAAGAGGALAVADQQEFQDELGKVLQAYTQASSAGGESLFWRTVVCVGCV